MEMNEHGCVPAQLYLHKQVAGRNWPVSHSLPITDQVGLLISRSCPTASEIRIHLASVDLVSVVSWESPGPPIPSKPPPSCRMSRRGPVPVTELLRWPPCYGGRQLPAGLELLPRTTTCLAGVLSGLLALPHEALKLAPWVLAGGQVLCKWKDQLDV